MFLHSLSFLSMGEKKVFTVGSFTKRTLKRIQFVVEKTRFHYILWGKKLFKFSEQMFFTFAKRCAIIQNGCSVFGRRFLLLRVGERLGSGDFAL